MPIRPASEIPLLHGDHAVTLRASLRAAVALDALPGGFGGVFDDLARQSLPAIHAVIRAAATDRQEAERLLAFAATKPLASFLISAQAACLALIMTLLPEKQGEAPPTGKGVPLSEFFASLYRYATGWLGWPPSEVWNASIAELEEALSAHIDRLLKLTPGASSTTPPPGPSTDYTPERLKQIEEQGFDPAFDREGLRALKARHHA
jgi:hypothetical protein